MELFEHRNDTLYRVVRDPLFSLDADFKCAIPHVLPLLTAGLTRLTSPVPSEVICDWRLLVGGPLWELKAADAWLDKNVVSHLRL